MKRIMFLLAALVVLSAVVFAGGNKQEAAPGVQVVRWSMWGGEARIRATQQAIDKFTEKTGIIVAMEPAPGTGDHFTKFLTQLAGGNAADIVQLGGDFSNLGLADTLTTVDKLDSYLLPLDPYVKSGILDLSNVDPAAIQMGTRNGQLFALPLGTNLQAMLYNKSLLQRVGAPLPKVSMTWAEFDAWIRQVQARLPAGTYALTDYSATPNGSFFFGYWAGQNGTSQWDGKRTYLTAAEAQKYFDLWDGWRKAGLIPPAARSAEFAESNEGTSSLIAGVTAVTCVWTNQLIPFQTATRDELDLITFPNAEASKGLAPQASQMMGINAKSKNPEAAVKFLNYRAIDPEAWKFTGQDPGVPSTPAARAASATSPEAQKIAAYLDVAGKFTSPRNPNMPSDSEYNSGLHLIAQNVAYGRLTSAAAGQQVMDLIYRLTNTRP